MQFIPLLFEMISSTEISTLVHLFVFILPENSKTVHFKLQTIYVQFGHFVSKWS